MAKRSFVYRNIFIYRLVMNLLYLGKYKERFEPVIGYLKTLPAGSRVLELCFGDIYVADFCKRRGHAWTGLDINVDFIKTATRMGFDAREADVTNVKALPSADVSVMMGSLYHFHPETGTILARMFDASPTVVISEPVSNLSAQGGLIGLLARKGANAGKGHETFRYDRTSFLAMLEAHQKRIGYRIADTRDHGKDLIVKLEKNENR